MTELRPYEENHAETVLSWIPDEKTMKMWSVDRFTHFPITAQELNEYYSSFSPSDNFSVWTFCDDGETVGHITLKHDKKADSVRFALIIVDSAKRGRGYGKKMLSSALEYAFNSLNAKEATLGVYDKNVSAYNCYINLGFYAMPERYDLHYAFLGEDWRFIQLKMAAEDYKGAK